MLKFCLSNSKPPILSASARSDVRILVATPFIIHVQMYTILIKYTYKVDYKYYSGYRQSSNSDEINLQICFINSLVLAGEINLTWKVSFYSSISNPQVLVMYMAIFGSIK